MATRLYLPSSGSSAIVPAQTQGWDGTVSTGLGQYAAVTTPIASTMTGKGHVDGNATDQDIVFFQYVYGPLAAQTIAAQTVKWQIGASETNAQNNLFTAIMLYTTAADGITKHQLTAAVERDATEIVAFIVTNRGHSFTTTSVAADVGDYLVIEIGVGGDPGVGGTHSSTVRNGDSAGSDLPEDDSSTSNWNPWVEFANDLALTTGTITVTSVVATATAAAKTPVPNVIVSPAASVATAAAKTPTRVGDIGVATVAATASAAAGVPSNVGNPNATITSVKAAATAVSGVPTVTLTVTSVASAATGAASSPSVLAIGDGADFIIPGPETREVYVGTAKAVYAQFLDADGNFYNPATVTFRTVAPSGVPLSYVWGVDSEVEQAAQGVYFLTFTVDQAGPWVAGARGEDGDATNQVTFTAKRSIFD